MLLYLLCADILSSLGVYNGSVIHQCTLLPTFPLKWGPVAQILQQPFVLRELSCRAVGMEGKLSMQCFLDVLPHVSVVFHYQI